MRQAALTLGSAPDCGTFIYTLKVPHTHPPMPKSKGLTRPGFAMQSYIVIVSFTCHCNLHGCQFTFFFRAGKRCILLGCAISNWAWQVDGGRLRGRQGPSQKQLSTGQYSSMVWYGKLSSYVVTAQLLVQYVVFSHALQQLCCLVVS